jgi:hypothetical protein
MKCSFCGTEGKYEEDLEEDEESEILTPVGDVDMCEACFDHYH